MKMNETLQLANLFRMQKPIGCGTVTLKRLAADGLSRHQDMHMHKKNIFF